MRYLSILFFISFFANSAQETIVQGPFKVPGDDNYVTIKYSSDDSNCPLTLSIDKVNTESVVDEYCQEGARPQIESVFFSKREHKPQVLILVSWFNNHRAENLMATYYKVYSYIKTGQIFEKDSKIDSDINLSGFDGLVDGENVTFKYKNAAEIKRYLLEKQQ